MRNKIRKDRVRIPGRPGPAYEQDSQREGTKEFCAVGYLFNALVGFLDVANTENDFRMSTWPPCAWCPETEALGFLGVEYERGRL